jgi:endonuclease/exonuclease/phosphatase family metal-dependent hydrolase
MSGGPLVVATFNIRNGLAFDGWHSWPLRRRSTAAALRNLDADVIGLQEAYRFQLGYLQRALPGHDSRSEGRIEGRRGEHCPVLVRRSRLRVVDWRSRWYGEREDRPGGMLPGATFPRLATWVRLREDEHGVEFDVINTHLDEHRAENRVASVEQLVTWLSPDRPTIVMGDFNATEANRAVFSPLLAAGLRRALPSDAGGSIHRFTGRMDGPRIDHVLVSGHWTVRDGRVVADPTVRPLPSDHWPVVATLLLGRD